MTHFSVAIPTFNSEQRLPDVLERLRSQVNTEALSWEVMVIDNNSSDRTAEIVQTYQENWPHSFPLKYYFEPRQGAAFARQRAIDEAQGEFVGFLDDDNLPALDWVFQAYTFGKNYPQAGAFGSQIHGDFEVEPPPGFDKLACFLAIVERGSEPHLYEPRKLILPPGAGLVVRKQAWQTSVPEKLVLNNKGKEAGLASEDLEVGLYIQRAGWQIWYNPHMQIQHKIPRWRLEKEYLLSLVRCIGLSKHHIRMMRLQPWLRPAALPAYVASDFYKLMVHLIQHAKDSQNDLVLACETELLFNSLISPFFLLKVRFQEAVNQSFFKSAPSDVPLLLPTQDSDKVLTTVNSKP